MVDRCTCGCNEWVSVEERLPTESQFYLAWCGDSGRWKGTHWLFWNDESGDWVGFIGGRERVYDVTHWMSLPEGPGSNDTVCKGTCRDCRWYIRYMASATKCMNRSAMDFRRTVRPDHSCLYYEKCERECECREVRECGSCTHWKKPRCGERFGNCRSKDRHRAIHGDCYAGLLECTSDHSCGWWEAKGECKCEEKRACVETRECGNCTYWHGSRPKHCTNEGWLAQNDNAKEWRFYSDSKFSCGWWEDECKSHIGDVACKEIEGAVFQAMRDLARSLVHR